MLDLVQIDVIRAGVRAREARDAHAAAGPLPHFDEFDAPGIAAQRAFELTFISRARAALAP